MMFLEYIWLACTGPSRGLEARARSRPMDDHLIRFRQLAVAAGSAAISTTTDPGAIASTISVVSRIVRALPGISAVVM